MTHRPHPAARAAAAQPYTYTDGQGHELTLSAITDAVQAPYVRVGGENTAVGGAVASVWLPLDQAHALDRALSDRTPYEVADHMGDTLTVTVADDFTTFTVTRLEDEDDDTASVPVVALTGRLPEIRRALTATAEEAEQRSAAADAELIEHARTVGMVEPERAPEFVAAYRAHVEEHSTAHGAQQVPTLADVEEQQRQAMNEQPTAPTWEDRAAHAVGMYATTAVELEDARRDAAQLRARLAAVEQLCGGRPSYHTITVKALLTAMSDADDDQADEQPAPLTAAEAEQGQADADHLAAEHPDTIESLLDELADDIPNRRARAIAADYLARYTRLLAADAHAHSSQRGTEMRAEKYRGRAAWCSGMREIARQLDARADAIAEAGR
ncbi:hypothetical protein ACFWXZ_14375 [[Kitasatospora] papulosa]|uniref:hypothetical protein n=1 Tax=[Kitasatospora] papulosa TaxID=1464011 RepID=UPI003682366C